MRREREPVQASVIPITGPQPASGERLIPFVDTAPTGIGGSGDKRCDAAALAILGASGQPAGETHGAEARRTSERTAAGPQVAATRRDAVSKSSDVPGRLVGLSPAAAEIVLHVVMRRAAGPFQAMTRLEAEPRWLLRSDDDGGSGPPAPGRVSDITRGTTIGTARSPGPRGTAGCVADHGEPDEDQQAAPT